MKGHVECGDTAQAHAATVMPIRRAIQSAPSSEEIYNRPAPKLGLGLSTTAEFEAQHRAQISTTSVVPTVGSSRHAETFDDSP
jgi:hypothetical protein